MRKCVDYISKSKQADMDRINSLDRIYGEAYMNLLLNEIVKYLDQYHIIKDEAKRQKVENDYYEKLCRLAQIQGGRVELDINEDYYIASLTYTGKELILDRDFYIEMQQFIRIMQNSDTISINTDGDYFKITFTFEMHKKLKHEDDHKYT